MRTFVQPKLFQRSLPIDLCRPKLRHYLFVGIVNADLLRPFEIDDELEFDRLLEPTISWFDAVEIFLY